VKLKVDLHTHTGEDPEDGLRYPALAFVEHAIKLKFDALAITLHGKVLDVPGLADYAAERGLLLIPAVEWIVQRRDVLLYNVTQTDCEKLRTWDDLRRFRKERGKDLLVVAPHPCYPPPHSLHREFERHIDLFDAVEYSRVYLSWLNFNRPAEKIARRHGLPVIATSDAHALWMLGEHFTIVDAAEKSVPAIFDAIRNGRVEMRTRPLTLTECFRTMIVENLNRNKRGTVVTALPPRSSPVLPLR
jgi:predicted metal-dependent phosphoesterase TrpH